MALRVRFGFVAGFGPAARSRPEIGRPMAQPFELVPLALHNHQCMTQIDRVIGAKSEFPTGF